MSQVLETPRRDGLNWHAFARVLKYDDDAVAWAAGRSGLAVPDGDCLSRLVTPFEIAEADGNLLTTAGLNRIGALIIAGGGTAPGNTTARIGVGDTATAATVADTDLGAAAGSTHRQFVIMDATYPSQTNGVITFQSTFTSALANFAWAEWGVDVGTATVANGTTVAALLLNHKIASLGTKTTGSWVFQGIITLS